MLIPVPSAELCDTLCAQLILSGDTHQPSFPAVWYQWAWHTSHSLRVHFCLSQVSPALQTAVLPLAQLVAGQAGLHRRKQNQQEGKPALQPTPPSASARETRSLRVSVLAAPVHVAGCML